jgi:hypothetical protein
VSKDGIEGIVKEVMVERLYRCCVAVDVVLKVSTEKAGAIPGVASVTRLKK